jgi:hypothetical protein
MMKTIAVVILILAFLLAGLIWGQYSWQKDTVSRYEQLRSAQASLTSGYAAQHFKELPEPVQRYLSKVLPPNQPMIKRVRMHHRGEFNMSEKASKWSVFSSDQWVFTDPIGFDWDARIEAFPKLPIFVHDSYIQKKGILRAYFAGVIPLANMSGTAEMAQGELMRYFAEAPWYPTALLPSEKLTWKAIDQKSARLVAKDGDHEIQLIFHFKSEDLIDSVRADQRSRTVEGKLVPTAWEGRWNTYARHDGMLIPTQGEVAWLPDASNAQLRQPYWRGRLESIQYDYANNKTQ